MADRQGDPGRRPPVSVEDSYLGYLEPASRHMVAEEAEVAGSSRQSPSVCYPRKAEVEEVVVEGDNCSLVHSHTVVAEEVAGSSR